jgi:hypothetical protein
MVQFCVATSSAGSIRGDQPLRVISKDVVGTRPTSATLEGTEWLVRETTAGRYQIKLLVAKEAGRIKSLWIQRVPGPGYGG